MANEYWNNVPQTWGQRQRWNITNLNRKAARCFTFIEFSGSISGYMIVISDAKSISKAIGLKPSRTRDYLKQLVDMAGFFGLTATSNFVELVDCQKNVVAESLER